MNRVGVHGFFCIVRNSPDYHMMPQWYFTTPELEQYMPIAVGKRWDTTAVGTRVEAFAIAGCDVASSVVHLTNLTTADFRPRSHSKLKTEGGILQEADPGEDQRAAK